MDMREKLLRQNANYTVKIEALLKELADYADPTLNRSPRPGAWSALQVCWHLIEAESLSLAYVRKKMQATDDLPKAGWKSGRAKMTLWFYLNTPLRFKAPAVVADEKLPERSNLHETRARWMQVRAAWRDYFEQLPNDLLDKAVYRHPFVGRLSWSGVFTFFVQHFMRHRKQIRRTLRAAQND